MSLQKNVLEAMLNSSRSVFNVQSLRMLTDCKDSQKLTQSLHYYIKEGKIRNPRRGIYTKATYDEKEMACSLYRPAYISLEYVLQKAGVIFQYDSAITSVSYLNREIEMLGMPFRYSQIKGEILCNMNGIERRDNINIATPERALLDMMYLHSECYFDNLRPINKKKVMRILPIYNSARLTARVKELFKK